MTEATLEQYSLTQATAFQTDDFAEGRNAFNEKQAAKFKDG